jgi:hypothetical protein
MLDSLPDALLHLVFVRLPPKTLLTSVCFVNKRFKRLITESEVSCALLPLLRGLEAKQFFSARRQHRRLAPPPTPGGCLLLIPPCRPSGCPSSRQCLLGRCVKHRAAPPAAVSRRCACRSSTAPSFTATCCATPGSRWRSRRQHGAAGQGQDALDCSGRGAPRAWGEPAAEGLTTEAGATPPMPPPPLPPFSRQVRSSPAVRHSRLMVLCRA